ncbi:MAG: hypothetical protein M3N97_00965 [Pseudomonadota bacterium]|nr:hypothetical protein [Pseudomonadota bacterium]
MNLRMAGCLVALLIISTATPGADFRYIDHEPFTNHKYAGSAETLVLSGEIIPGDYDRLLNKILDDENRFMLQNTVILASNGGDVAEAIKIARLLKAMYTEVQVGPLTGRCVSACFLIYAAASERKTDDERLIGIHRPYVVDSQLSLLSPADADNLENKVLKQARAYLQESNVPTYLIEEMFRRASNDVYWLSERDIENIGHRTPAFDQYLVAKCAWDDTIEREAYSGKRPFDDLKEMWTCRDQVARPAAHQAFFLAYKELIERENRKVIEKLVKNSFICHTKGVVDPKTEECPDFTPPTSGAK